MEVNLLLQLKVLVSNKINLIKHSEEIDKQISEVLVYLDIQTKYEKKDHHTEHLQELFKEVCQQIEEKCEHHYIKDDIDIGPETSMKIEYCVICEKQK